MVGGRHCTFVHGDGRVCPATPLREEPFCFWHWPDKEKEEAEARRLRCLRRRREKAVSGAYDFAGLASVEAIGRILKIAVLDNLGLENSIARSRVLIAAAVAAARLLDVGELEERLAALETALGRRPPPAPLSLEPDGDDPLGALAS